MSNLHLIIAESGSHEMLKFGRDSVRLSATASISVVFGGLFNVAKISNSRTPSMIVSLEYAPTFLVSSRELAFSSVNFPEYVSSAFFT